jgi:hypothetical protein
MEYTNLMNLLSKIGEEGKELYKAKLKSGAYASGKLYNNVKYRVNVNDNKITLTLYDLEKYYLNIENGRKAGGKMPPISIIRKWMKFKGLPDKPGAAYLIARSIAKKGIKPKPYIREISAKIKQDYSDDIKRALELDLKEQIKIIK